MKKAVLFLGLTGICNGLLAGLPNTFTGKAYYDGTCFPKCTPTITPTVTTTATRTPSVAPSPTPKPTATFTPGP